ncbi:MAG: cytochrome c [Acidobacteriaceae bacterium]|nr:cytochrome c [Acidobacteriaceae bacterium]
MRTGNLLFSAVLLSLGVAVVAAQQPSPAAGAGQTNKTPPEGTQNAPPPAGGAANNRKLPQWYQGGGGDYPDYNADVVQRGQKIFQSNCSFCHGANAKGGESGPDLLRSVTVLHDKNGDLIGPVVHNGRPEKGMPKFPLTDAQIRDIATFLHQKVKDAALRGTYQILNIVTGDAKQGEAYFNGAGHCSGCHSVSGDLAHIGSRLEPVEVQQHIVMPREGRWWIPHAKPSKGQEIRASVTLPSGETVEGVLDHIDDFNVSLTDGNGEYRSFPRDGDSPKIILKDPLQAHTEMLTKYKDSDIHNLTAYLVSLK